jgi:serine/threonine-protein kinase
MANQPATDQVTEDYRGEPPSGPPIERVRVALVAGPRPVATDDLYRLLRRRLLIVCSILAGGFVAGLGVDLLMRVVSTRPEVLIIAPSEWLLHRWGWFLQLAVVSVAAVVLWRRPPRSVRGLRVIEVFMVGMLTMVVLREGVTPRAWGFLEEAAREPDRIRYAFEGGYLNGVGLFWFVVLTIYGAFIPNTWRRCAAMVVLLGASPLVLFAIYGYWLRPIDPETATKGLLYLGFWIGLAAVIAVFSSSRIEILQRQAAEARKLGQYILKERLGTGGMGEVYRAEHVLLRRPCALKVIRPERTGDPKQLRRFEREVQVTATLTHPNTVQIFDYGHAADGTFYYVMEYLPGLTLEELVRREGSLQPARAIHFLRQICGALREAHGRGLTHRDIKPGNVMVCERGGIPDVAKLLDFGLVLPPGGQADGEKLTQDRAITGTPAYLSPEQAGGQEAVDARSDLYSVGALAYFLLTGRPPFAGRSSVKMLAAHLYEEPEPLSARRTDVPRDLEAVVLRCLAKNPEARFPDAESLDAALAACQMIGVEVGGDGRAGRTIRCS